MKAYYTRCSSITVQQVPIIFTKMYVRWQWMPKAISHNKVPERCLCSGRWCGLDFCVVSVVLSVWVKGTYCCFSFVEWSRFYFWGLQLISNFSTATFLLLPLHHTFSSTYLNTLLCLWCPVTENNSIWGVHHVRCFFACKLKQRRLSKLRDSLKKLGCAS